MLIQKGSTSLAELALDLAQGAMDECGDAIDNAWTVWEDNAWQEAEKIVVRDLQPEFIDYGNIHHLPAVYHAEFYDRKDAEFERIIEDEDYPLPPIHLEYSADKMENAYELVKEAASLDAEFQSWLVEAEEWLASIDNMARGKLHPSLAIAAMRRIERSIEELWAHLLAYKNLNG